MREVYVICPYCYSRMKEHDEHSFHCSSCSRTISSKKLICDFCFNPKIPYGDNRVSLICLNCISLDDIMVCSSVGNCNIISNRGCSGVLVKALVHRNPDIYMVIEPAKCCIENLAYFENDVDIIKDGNLIESSNERLEIWKDIIKKNRIPRNVKILLKD